MITKRTEEEVYKCIKAQNEYVNKAELPHFAPKSGRCYACGRNIYQAYLLGSRESQGINLERATKELVTGCPHCHRSYCD